LARVIGGRVGRCQNFNPNQGEWETREVKGRVRDYRVRAGEASSTISLEIRGFETTVAFALGTPDKICLMNQRLEVRAPLTRLQAFVSKTLDPELAREWLQDSQNLKALKALGCSKDEPLQVYRNGVVMQVSRERATPEQLARLLDVADRCPRLARQVKPGHSIVDGLELDPQLLPEDLRRLVPYIIRWAVGDDIEREETLSRAKRKEIAQLLKDVGPSLSRIDEYLDRFGSDPLSNEAVLLGRLAEAVAEARANQTRSNT